MLPKTASELQRKMQRKVDEVFRLGIEEHAREVRCGQEEADIGDVYDGL